MRSQYGVLTAALALIATGCGQPPAPGTSALEMLPVPVVGDGTGPRLSSDSAGELLLSWAERNPDGDALRFSDYRNGQWQQPRTVVDSVTMFVNWADLRSVVPLGNGDIAAHWLVKRPGGFHAYDIAFSRSRDDGRSWSPPISPHTDGTPTQHGFVSLFPLAGSVGLIWLDGRNTSEVEGDYPVTGGMTLRAAFVDENQQRYAEQLIDALVCSCCPTDVAIAASGPVAVYRDRTEDEIRDISVARFIDEQWRTGQRIAEDNWAIDACPVNGPKIIADGLFIAVAWFTAADSRAAVKLNFSRDSGETFSVPIEVPTNGALGQVGLAHLGSGAVALSWLETSRTGYARLLVRRVNDRGQFGDIKMLSREVRRSSVPQLARIADQLIFVWTEGAQEEDRIVSARLPIDALDSVD